MSLRPTSRAWHVSSLLRTCAETRRATCVCTRPRYRRGMGRRHRYLAAGAYYHVGTKGNNDAPIFLDDWDRRVFLQLLRRVRNHYRWRLHARCLLGNHYHLLVETPLGNLSDGMRDLNGQYARAFNERHRRKHHVFGQRFWSTVIDSEAQYDHTLDYIVHNPVNHGFTRRVGDWRWTSPPAA